VDGLNFHFGVAKRFGRRWIDLPALCRRVLSPRWHLVTEVRLYTAPFLEGVDGGDVPEHQRSFLRALEACGETSVHLGRFSVHAESARMVKDPKRMVQVTAVREKGSDVNLATDLVYLACSRRYEAAVVVSNDADFAGAIRLVRERIHLPVGIVNPNSGRSSRDLLAVAAFERSIRRRDVLASLLPEVIETNGVTIQRPSGW